MPVDRSMTPRIESQARVAPGATVVGDVDIARVWENARTYVELTRSYREGTRPVPRAGA